MPNAPADDNAVVSFRRVTYAAPGLSTPIIDDDRSRRDVRTARPQRACGHGDFTRRLAAPQGATW